MTQPRFDRRLVEIGGLRRDELIESDVAKKRIIALRDPKTVIVERGLAKGDDVAQPPERLGVKVVRENERRCDEILGHPPGQSRSDFSERIDQPDNKSVPFSSVDPAMETAARLYVGQD